MNRALLIHSPCRAVHKAVYCIQKRAGYFSRPDMFALFPPVLFSLELFPPWSHCPLCSSQLPDASSRACPGPAEHPEVVALTSVTIWCLSCSTVAIVAHMPCACSLQFMWIGGFWTKGLLSSSHVCLNLFRILCFIKMVSQCRSDLIWGKYIEKTLENWFFLMALQRSAMEYVFYFTVSKVVSSKGIFSFVIWLPFPVRTESCQKEKPFVSIL